MKLLSVLAFAGLSVAQIQTFIDVVNKVNTATGDLDTAVKAFNGPGDVAKLQAASDNVGTVVADGVKTINGAQSITLTDAITLQGQVTGLQTTVEGVVNDLIAKKDTLVSAGAGADVEKNLQSQLEGANALSSAISSKVPPEVSQLAQQLSAGIATALQKGVDAFKDAGGPAPSGPGSAPAPSSASSSVAVPTAMPSTMSMGSGSMTMAMPSTTAGGPASQFTGAAATPAIMGGAALAAMAVMAL